MNNILGEHISLKINYDISYKLPLDVYVTELNSKIYSAAFIEIYLNSADEIWREIRNKINSL